MRKPAANGNNADDGIDGKAVGARIRASRRAAGLGQKELAERIGVITRSVQNYERGRVPWTYLDAISEALNKPKDWLLYGETDTGADRRFPGDLPRELRDEFANRHDEIMGALAHMQQLLRDQALRLDRIEHGKPAA